MRRWKLTIVLAVTAGLALWLAPRLFAEAPAALQAPRVHASGVATSIPEALPEVVSQLPEITSPPAIPSLPAVPPVPIAAGIPELANPVTPPAPPPVEVEEAFWDGCPACGMG